MDATGLAYSENIVNWNNSKKFDTDYDGPVPYYDKVAQSLNIAPPKETPPTLESFPDFIQEYIMETGGILDMYLELLERSLSNIAPEDVVKVLRQEVEGRNLYDIDPVFAYCILSIINTETDELKEYLLSTYSNKFQKIFDHINNRKNK
jgi:hypothetical protein